MAAGSERAALPILTGHISQRLVYRLLLNDARQDEKSADRGADHQNESNLTHE